eukprot:gene6399-6630_t
MAAESIYWIVVVGGIIAWVMAYGIGANDVANAFGTSVGARTLTLKWAVVIATIMESLGAIFLGGAVSNTISGGIADPLKFAAAPDVFAYGMLCALSAAAIWLLIATYLEAPVSTTHSIIGGVLGFGLVYGGADVIVWAGRRNDFPYITGIVVIVASWFTSPVITGIMSYVMFIPLRALVLRSPTPMRAIWCLPGLLAFTVFINLFFILQKGVSNIIKLPIEQCLWLSGAAGGGAGALGIVVGVPMLRRQLKIWEATM